MTRDDLAARVAGVAALADPIRRDLYLYVSAPPTPISRDEASDALGIARHTAKFHLDKLAEEGLLDISFKRLSERRGPGAGRPTKLYARSSRQLSVILPERRYDLAGKLLATAIGLLFALWPRLAATLEAAMLGVITVLVWLPPLLVQPHDSGAWSAFLMSSAIAAGAAAVADSYRGIGWTTRGLHP